jgi:hypothetical protein
MAFNILLKADCTNLSSYAGIPSGLFFLVPGFGIFTLQHNAYRLLPNCLRLTPTVTRWCPRLAMSGLLDLAQWDSHPLYDTPLSWRTVRHGLLALIRYLGALSDTKIIFRS